MNCEVRQQMIIHNIEFENFRNFKGHGEIKCSTDGKVTIIYGKNGDGKTTLHQLFQWVFYGQVHFNKTTTDRLYNLKFESEQAFGSMFSVMGRIDFEHDNESYSLTRSITYKKGLDDSEKISEDMVLNKMDDDNNWRRMDRPKDTIEKLLPSGLSEYFFFDGESMIADLRVKGRDSAGKLKKALYSMFDLDILDAAISHIGETDLKTTVLGKLYLEKGTISSGSQISAIKTNIENVQNKLRDFAESSDKIRTKQEQNKAFITSVSEQIGSTKSKSEYERQRKDYKRQRDAFIANAEFQQSSFGDAVMDVAPNLFISKSVNDAKKKIHLKVENNVMPSGVGKQLLKYLLAESTKTCICGNPLCEQEKKHLQSFYDMLPPRSYASLYHDFTRTAQIRGKEFNKDILEKHILSVLNNNGEASKCDAKIRELDEAEKKSPDIEDLVVNRQKAEETVKECEQQLSDFQTQTKKHELYLKKQMEEFDKLTKGNESSKKVLRQIDIMQAVKAHFIEKLADESVEYSEKLQENIQLLLNDMLTSKRKVTVSQEFAVKVTDSYNDESKSEGQFAVVSFAYIGGILKMLQSEEHLSSKEYPLVLDGPFSKLDPDQRQNVADMIPSFAPQVILFSKDDLQDVFNTDNIGRIWTIVSNDEKNDAHIEEGYLWK